MDEKGRFPDRSDRRTFLAGSATLGVAGLAGCLGLFGGDDDGDDDGSDLTELGYGRQGQELGGTSMAEMPDLEGELSVYSGRGEFLVGNLLSYIEDLYDDFSFSPQPRYGNSTELANTIVTEGDGTSADVFFSVDAGSLGMLADEGRTRTLSDDVLEMVGEEFRTDGWIGTSGRARSIPYNTNVLSEDDLPDSIMEYPDGVDAQLGWAPGYASCQAFVTAMRILEGEDATRQWLESVVDAGIATYGNELAVCEAVADGDLDAGFTNHYYIQRVKDGREDAPIATTFTQGDAGAIFNVAGAAVIDEADDPELAENFIRHLLSTEAQDYFAVRTFEYPLVEGVPPVGELPSIEDLDVPNMDLTRLSDLEPTVDMMRDVGVQF
ncbi:extracellular solute-binding protein [Natribaculum luteum]|uniref:Extracellular solute-binding protein n=1 Tax=Natribaculum luteum TaxID=1586232 RepID=A0ABD5P3D7_9EURY|nr:extracellular solute-binding protein [Natribaculum luteum]